MSDEKNREKIVYIPMSADILHPGHLNIIREGLKYGTVVVGLMTDEALATYKRVPFMNYDQRYAVVSSVSGVSEVIPQSTLDYRPNLHKLRPDYMVHASDWRQGVMSKMREQAFEVIQEWGGQLIEPEYTEGISSTDLQRKVEKAGVSPVWRLERLQKIIATNKLTRVLEAHDGLSALIVERSEYKADGKKPEQFDAIWVGSLTDSLAKGKPDIEVVDTSSRLATINEILEVTTKPIMFDGDTGGQKEHFVHLVRTLERLGVSAVVIEDKTGLKRNSLHNDMTEHTQEDIDVFSAKIKAGVAVKRHDEFMIIARIESLIITGDQDDALKRAKAYIAAGASAIMIHSKDKSGSDVKLFAEGYAMLTNRPPLMVVPTSYSSIYEDELAEWGVSITVYANQLLRSAYPAMQQAAQTILQTKRGAEVDSVAASVEDMLKLFPDS